MPAPIKFMVDQVFDMSIDLEEHDDEGPPALGEDSCATVVCLAFNNVPKFQKKMDVEEYMPVVVRSDGDDFGTQLKRAAWLSKVLSVSMEPAAWSSIEKELPQFMKIAGAQPSRNTATPLQHIRRTEARDDGSGQKHRARDGQVLIADGKLASMIKAMERLEKRCHELERETDQDAMPPPAVRPPTLRTMPRSGSPPPIGTPTKVDTDTFQQLVAQWEKKQGVKTLATATQVSLSGGETAAASTASGSVDSASSHPVSSATNPSRDYPDSGNPAGRTRRRTNDDAAADVIRRHLDMDTSDFMTDEAKDCGTDESDAAIAAAADTLQGDGHGELIDGVVAR